MSRVPPQIGSRQLGRHPSRGGLGIGIDLKIPQSQHPPSELAKLCVCRSIPHDVSAYLAIPVETAAARPPLAGMTMPKPPIHENRESRTSKRKVGLAGEILTMASPASNTDFEQGAAKGELRPGVPALYSGHHPATHLRWIGIGHPPSRLVLVAWSGLLAGLLTWVLDRRLSGYLVVASPRESLQAACLGKQSAAEALRDASLSNHLG